MTIDKKLYTPVGEWILTDKESDKVLPPVTEPPQEVLDRTREVCKSAAELAVKRPSLPGNVGRKRRNL